MRLTKQALGSGFNKIAGAIGGFDPHRPYHIIFLIGRYLAKGGPARALDFCGASNKGFVSPSDTQAANIA